MFYDKKVKLYELKPIENEHGALVEKRYVYIKTIMVDIQPYSQEKLQEEYGYDLKTTKRMFCEVDNSIKESSIVVYKGKSYKIVKIIGWDDEDSSIFDEFLDIPLDDAVGVDLVE